MPTYREIYFSLLSINDPYIKPEIILELFCYIMGKDKSKVLLDFDKEFPSEKLDIVERIKKHEPIQYITGFAWFLGEKYKVSEKVLIPRQETEQLVLSLTKLIKNKFKNKKISLLDLCCGSGVIGLALNKKNNINLSLSDISQDALKIAKENCKLYDVNHELFESDLFGNIPYYKYDVIVSNPPYIESKETVDEQVLKYEPHLALFNDKNNDIYERIFKEAKKYLSNSFILAFEIGEDSKSRLSKLAEKYFNNCEIIFEKDLYNKDRFLYIIK